MSLYARNTPPGTERGTGPWRLAELKQTPSFEIAATRLVQEGDRTLALSELYYGAEPWLGKPTRVFACYAVPEDRREHRLPAMVLIHGGGGTASPEWARLWAARGYAALAMDLYGQGPDRKRLPDGGADWSDRAVAFRLTEGLENGWIYQAVASILRGISVLQALPEVDPERIGVTGVSWGGYFTCMAMSLDDRLRVAVPVYGSGFNPDLGIDPEATEAEREVVRTTFHAERYLPHCRVPLLWVTGTNERYAAPDRVLKSHRITPGPGTLCITPRPSHIQPQMSDRGWERQEIHLFTDAVFRGAPGLACVAPPVLANDALTARYESPVPLDGAAVHWTMDLGLPWEERRWSSAYAALNEADGMTAPLPTERPALAFLTLMDRRGAITSSEFVELA